MRVCLLLLQPVKLDVGKYVGQKALPSLLQYVVWCYCECQACFCFFKLHSLGDITASVTSKFVDFQHLKTSFYPMYSVCESRKL